MSLRTRSERRNITYRRRTYMDYWFDLLSGPLTLSTGKRRRVEGGFLGAEFILPQIKDGVSKRRVGFVIEGAPAREHAEIYANGELIGHVTSGCPAPSLKKNIAIGYVKSGFHKSGTAVEIKVRNKMQKAVVTKMPFVPSSYHRIE